MHELISMASTEQLASFAEELMEMLESNKEVYDIAESILHRKIYGDHFCQKSLDKALNLMANEDGTTGGHWNVEQTKSVANQNGYRLSKYNEYDWNYVMNMLYSDYYSLFGDDAQAYAKMAFKFLADPDAPDGKAYKYYHAMQKRS